MAAQQLVGSLSVELSVDSAKFISGMKKAKDAVQSDATAMQQEMGKVKKSFTDATTALKDYSDLAAKNASKSTGTNATKSVETNAAGGAFNDTKARREAAEKKYKETANELCEQLLQTGDLEKFDQEMLKATDELLKVLGKEDMLAPLKEGFKTWGENAKKTITKEAKNFVKTGEFDFSGIFDSLFDSLVEQLEDAAGKMVSDQVTKIADPWIDKLTDSANSLLDDVKNKAISLWGDIKKGAGTLWDGIKGAASSLWDGIKGAASSLWSDASSFLSNAFNSTSGSSSIWGSIAGLFSGGGGGMSDSALWDFIGPAAWGGVSAKGNVFSDGRLIPFASGGVVSKPMIFPMAQGLGLMGEAGPEAILPLKRGANGNLGVEASGGGNVSINIINNVGASVSAEERQSAGGMEIDVMIDQAVAKKLSQFGSQSNKALRQNFGARQQLTGR